MAHQPRDQFGRFVPDYAVCHLCHRPHSIAGASGHPRRDRREGAREPTRHGGGTPALPPAKAGGSKLAALGAGLLAIAKDKKSVILVALTMLLVAAENGTFDFLKDDITIDHTTNVYLYCRDPSAAHDWCLEHSGPAIAPVAPGDRVEGGVGVGDVGNNTEPDRR